MGPQPFNNIPNVMVGIKFPVSILNLRLNNNELIKRDWLTWSSSKQALNSFPCRLFCNLPESQRSLLSVENG